MSQPKPTACILCPENCGLQVTVEDRRLKNIRGDKQHPHSHGYVCNKPGRLDSYQNHADRLTSPLKRREDGTFEAVSWDEAIAGIAAELARIKDAHSGRAIAYYGGGGQGNHLPGVYATSLRAALDTPYVYSSLAQEKTGDFMVNGRLFGKQTCHVVADVQRAQVAMFLGTNPWQSHGFPRARKVLKELKADPGRTMIVVDPRVTETAKMADIHLQVRPGQDASLLAAILGVLVQDGVTDTTFLASRCRDAEPVLQTFASYDIAAGCARAGVEEAAVREVAGLLAGAESATIRADLGLQQSRHSTLNSYLEKLLFLLTGNLGKAGGNNFHTFLLPLIGHSKDASEGAVLTAVTGMHPISKLYPPNILPAEINTDHAGRIRAVIVDSSNPVRTAADTAAYVEAFGKLELLVSIDVALTETAALAHWVLPASSQFEKPEATFFSLSFPDNHFHLRRPVMAPLPGTLAEPEIYRRLCVALGALPDRFPLLERIAAQHCKRPGLKLLPNALKATVAMNRALMGQLPLVLYATLGKAMPANVRSGAVLWGAALRYAVKHEAAVRRAGVQDGPGGLGEALFRHIVDGAHGVILSVHEYGDTWSFLRTPDKKVRLAIPELLRQVEALQGEADITTEAFPFVLQAGERRAWNANTIIRDPSWRPKDREGALRIHPGDAERLGIGEGDLVAVSTRAGRVEATVTLSAALQPGLITLPHGYGLQHPAEDGGRAGTGVAINDLTSADWVDELTMTPLHKNVPARVEALG